jgi:hypothetical protein
MEQTTMGKRFTRWKMFLQFYDFTIIHTAGKNNVLTDVLSRIYEERTANTEAEIMEDSTINELFSTLILLLSPPFPDQYSLLSYPWFTTSNTTSLSLVLSSDPSYCNYQYQPDTIATMTGIQEHQAPSSVCDNEGCNRKHHNGWYVPIFGEGAYKIISALEDASLHLGREFNAFTAPCSCQPSQVALEEAKRNIRKLQEMVKQLAKLIGTINESDTDEETKEACEHIYTLVSER